MTELQSIKRKIFLKRQAVKVIRGEIATLQLRLALVQMQTDLEAKMKEGFKSELSRKLDCIQYLLDD